MVGGYWAGDGTTKVPTYTGLVDEVRIYDHPLSGTEIGGLYSNPGAVPEPASCALLGLACAAIGTALKRRKKS